MTLIHEAEKLLLLEALRWAQRGVGVEMSRKRKVTSIRVDPELWRLAKHLSVEEGISLRELIERALIDYIKKHGIDTEKFKFVRRKRLEE